MSLVEQTNHLDTNPRASHYAPNSVVELRRAGVYPEVERQGFKPDGVCWRLIDGTFLAGLKSPEVAKDPDAMICLPLDRLDKILLDEFEKQGNAEVLWNHKVVGIEQDEKEARIKVELGEKEKWLAADYVVGCDGANSIIRRSLFGNEYPGETLQHQIIATNVRNHV